MADYIKNIQKEKITKLASEVEFKEGQVISKTFAQNNHVSLTVFAFSKGEEISTHASSGDAMVTIIEGIGRITIDGKEYLLKKDETIIMPAQKSHAVYAEENFKMLLIVIFPS